MMVLLLLRTAQAEHARRARVSAWRELARWFCTAPAALLQLVMTPKEVMYNPVGQDEWMAWQTDRDQYKQVAQGHITCELVCITCLCHKSSCDTNRSVTQHAK